MNYMHTVAQDFYADGLMAYHGIIAQDGLTPDVWADGSLALAGIIIHPACAFGFDGRDVQDHMPGWSLNN